MISFASMLMLYLAISVLVIADDAEAWRPGDTSAQKGPQA